MRGVVTRAGRDSRHEVRVRRKYVVGKARKAAGSRKLGRTRPGCVRGAFVMLVVHPRQAVVH